MRKPEKILIIGAGEAGQMILREYRRRGLYSSVIGFLDDDPAKAEKTIEEKPVIGTTDTAAKHVAEGCLTRIIIAMPSASPERVHAIVEACVHADSSIPLHIVPSAERYFDTVPLLPSLQEMPLAELLGREEYQIDVKKITGFFAGKKVLVTGAGGSIGSEICRQLLKFGVGKIAALGRGEHSIYSLVRSLEDYTSDMKEKPKITYHIANVKDESMMRRVFEKVQPDIVFHAAAHKHVPLMEFNEAEALDNNVGGTRTVLDVSLAAGVNRFVLVSTDKAVRPTSIMGASKRIAEMVTGLYHQKGLGTAIVRFGNVIGSRGSVVPLFNDQIARGGPVTVTDPHVTRYFMSIPEASLLVINAAALSSGGEVYVLDMGKQYRVADVAKKLIELHGLVPGRDMEIVYTGLRPGEKKYEELFYNSDNLVMTGNKKIMIQKNGLTGEEAKRLEKFLESELPRIASLTSGEIRSLIKNLVPEYTPGSEPHPDAGQTRLAT